MNEREDYTVLIVFTTLAPTAVGGLVGLLLARGLRQEAGIDWAAVLVFSVGVVALAFSLLHLGRPWRAPLALLHLATSWLSREVLLFGLFLACLGCYAFLPALTAGWLSAAAGIGAGIFGLFSTLATGKTYQLHARPSWDQWLSMVTFPLAALSTGMLFGFFTAWLFDPQIQVGGIVWVMVAVLLVFSSFATWLRSIRQPLRTVEAGLSRQLVLEPYLWSLVLRITTAGIAILLIATGGRQQYFAWIPALVGELSDRFLFFNAVVPVSLRRRAT